MRFSDGKELEWGGRRAREWARHKMYVECELLSFSIVKRYVTYATAAKCHKRTNERKHSINFETVLIHIRLKTIKWKSMKFYVENFNAFSGNLLWWIMIASMSMKLKHTFHFVCFSSVDGWAAVIRCWCCTIERASYKVLFTETTQTHQTHMWL